MVQMGESTITEFPFIGWEWRFLAAGNSTVDH